MSNQLYRVQELMPGCSLAHLNLESVLFGCPSEIVKVCKLKNLLFPNHIVLPFHFYMNQVLQAALEFPVYDFLFNQHGFFKGLKLNIYGTTEQLARMRKILKLTLIGPERKQMEIWNCDAYKIDEIMRLQNYFRMKKPGTDIPAEIDDMINFIPIFNDSYVNVDGCQLKIKDENVFSLVCDGQEYLIDINIHEKQKPPIAIEPPEKLPPRSVLGATALSKCTTGFDPTGYTSGIILWLNGMGVSVDGVAWMKEHLKMLGINPHEIRAHIVTHIHEDHSNIMDMIVNGERFTIISDMLGYQCLLEKTALLLDMSTVDVAKWVDLIEFDEDKPLNWHGAEFEFWRTAHPVPTFGFRVTVGNGRNKRSIVYSGDTVWGGRKLADLIEKGIIYHDTFERIKRAPLLSSDLTIHDAGGGMIHPDIAEIAELPEQARSRIVLSHLPAIPEKFKDMFLPIIAGQHWDIIPQRQWFTSDLSQVTYAPILNGIGQEWMSAVISQGQIHEYPANHVLLNEGAPGKNFYIIIGGTVKVINQNGEEITQLATGDLFGEMSIMYDKPCSASIVSKSPVKTLELDKKLFIELSQDTGIFQRLESMHRVRPVCQQISFIANLPAHVQNRIYESAIFSDYQAGDVIIKQGEIGDFLYGVIEGKVSVRVHSVDGNGMTQEVAEIHKHELFGEMALLGNGIRTADVVAIEAVKVFKISKKAFEEVVGSAPMLNYSLVKLAEHRQKK